MLSLCPAISLSFFVSCTQTQLSSTRQEQQRVSYQAPCSFIVHPLQSGMLLKKINSRVLSISSRPRMERANQLFCPSFLFFGARCATCHCSRSLFSTRSPATLSVFHEHDYFQRWKRYFSVQVGVSALTNLVSIFLAAVVRMYRALTMPAVCAGVIAQV
ncbi:MAG: hypothetical protein J3R72DRAFT_428784 [Linnemannia gamsii]|nr:MAG: hypothetical protein J3R72DRAFT_428784 [Linnemannia gamsii]